MSHITWALSSWVCKYPDDLLNIPAESGFTAVEWDLNYIPLPISEKRCIDLMNTFKRRGIKLRFHLPYSTCDVGHPDKEVRKISMEYLKLNLRLLATLDADYCVLHFCSVEQTSIPSLDELLAVVEFANAYKINLGIENLLNGPTSEPSNLKKIALECGADVALDTGHALTVGKLDLYLQVLGEMITHIHFYGFEDAQRNHCPFADPRDATRVAMLLKNNCPASWWTCEMDSLGLCINTRNMAQDGI